jgi:hypothetical protein
VGGARLEQRAQLVIGERAQVAHVQVGQVAARQVQALQRRRLRRLRRAARRLRAILGRHAWAARGQGEDAGSGGLAQAGQRTGGAWAPRAGRCGRRPGCCDAHCPGGHDREVLAYSPWSLTAPSPRPALQARLRLCGNCKPGEAGSSCVIVLSHPPVRLWAACPGRCLWGCGAHPRHLAVVLRLTLLHLSTAAAVARAGAGRPLR